MTKLSVSCPNCGKTVPYTSENPFRPFCCKRCKLIDLGQWAREDYRIPDNTPSNEDPGRAT